MSRHFLRPRMGDYPSAQAFKSQISKLLASLYPEYGLLSTLQTAGKVQPRPWARYMLVSNLTFVGLTSSIRILQSN